MSSQIVRDGDRARHVTTIKLQRRPWPEVQGRNALYYDRAYSAASEEISQDLSARDDALSAAHLGFSANV